MNVRTPASPLGYDMYMLNDSVCASSICASGTRGAGYTMQRGLHIMMTS